MGVAKAVAETCWIHKLLLELHYMPANATIVYCDNVSLVYMSSYPIHYQRTKQIEIDMQFVRDKVAKGHILIVHLSSSLQYANIFTKNMSSSLFLDFRSSLNVREHNFVQTVGGC